LVLWSNVLKLFWVDTGDEKLELHSRRGGPLFGDVVGREEEVHWKSKKIVGQRPDDPNEREVVPAMSLFDSIPLILGGPFHLK
jgi:hypothetical protein